MNLMAPDDIGVANVTMAEAIRMAVMQSMMEDPDIFIMGEGVTDPKGVFGTTKDMLEAWGPDRVIETPNSEAAMTGVAIGAAMMGKRPILTHQRMEFALLSMEQLYNNAAKMITITDGAFHAPIVVRTMIGRGWGQGPCHSSSLIGMMISLGLTVHVPTSPHDAYHLMRDSLSADQGGAVIFVEHRWLHHVEGRVRVDRDGWEDDTVVEVRPGKDAAIITYGYPVIEATLAAKALEQNGINVAVWGIRTPSELFFDDQMEDFRAAFPNINTPILVVDPERSGSSLAAIAVPLKDDGYRHVYDLEPVGFINPSSRWRVARHYPDAEDIISSMAGAADITDQGPALDYHRRTTAREIDQPYDGEIINF